MSTPVGQQLIERLAAGVRPIEAGERALRGGAERFGDILLRAASGEVSSDLPVSVASGVDVELAPETLERIAALVDKAQAQGASHALVVTDEGMLELDVLRRRIEGVVDPSSGDNVLTGFDAVLLAKSDTTDPAELTGPLLLPDGDLSASAHESLLDALSNSNRNSNPHLRLAH